MSEFQVVPESVWEKQSTGRGRTPSSKLSKALLNGQIVFVKGPRRAWGSFYTLARNHGKQCETKRGIIHEKGDVVEGTLIRFVTPNNHGKDTL